MKRKRIIQPFVLIFAGMAMLLGACSKNDVANSNSDDSDSGNETLDTTASFATNSKDTTVANAVIITYSADSVHVENPFDEEGVTVTNTNGDVVVNSTISGTEVNYVLSGTINNGSFKLYSDYKYGLILNGVSLVNNDGPAVNIQSKKKGSVLLVGGTNNRLADASVYASSEEDQKGTVFSEGQLVFSGSGSLLVYGYNKHGIASDDYIAVKGGTISIKSAASDGIHAKDYFQMDGGTLNINASSDGIEADEGYVQLNGGNIDIASVDDGVTASYDGTDADVYVHVNGGILNIATTGTKGNALKSAGAIVVDSKDTIALQVQGVASKGISTDGDLTISEGHIGIVTSGNGMYDTDEKDIVTAAGIKVDGIFQMDAGVLNISSSGSGGKGISTDGNLIINGGTIDVTTSGSNYVYGSDNSAAKAIKSDADLTISGGDITVKTSTTEAEGIESKNILTVTGGNIHVEAYDDAINASKQIIVSGGKIYTYSSANDGMDCNGTFTFSGGLIISSGTSSPEEGFDCDNNTFKITGGTLIGIGGATSTPTASVSTQRTIIYGAGSISSDQVIRIQNASGEEILSFKSPRAYNSAVLLFSSPDIANSSYSIYSGGSLSGGTEWNNYYTGASYSGGTLKYTVTTSSMVTTAGSVSSGGGGGQPGGR